MEFTKNGKIVYELYDRVLVSKVIAPEEKTFEVPIWGEVVGYVSEDEYPFVYGEKSFLVVRFGDTKRIVRKKDILHLFSLKNFIERSEFLSKKPRETQ